MTLEIYTIDLNYQNTPETIGSYLILGSSDPILVDTGPASTLENLKVGLSQFNLALTDIKHVLVTHIHLDHSGAGGQLAEAGAKLYVHHVGYPHLVDPSRLIKSATRIYGEENMGKLWGTTIPAIAEQVTAVEDQQTITIGDLQFICHDTPGHAWHHMAYQLGDRLFTGDSVGNRLGNRPYTVLPAPPPEFKLDIWQQTLEKIKVINPKRLYPTHFGPILEAEPHIETFSQLLNDASNLVLEALKKGTPRDEIVELYKAFDIERGKKLGMSDGEIHQYIVSNPLHMSVDGIIRYWTRKGVV